MRPALATTPDLRRRPRRRLGVQTVHLASRGQLAVLDALALAWVAAAVGFWTWWLRPEHLVTGWGLALNSGALVFEFVVLPVWFLVFTRRARRPDRRGELPDLRAAMVVTKAPSEPWPLVRETLEAMLAQDIGRPYDVWLADEDPTPLAGRWCAAHGVRISTRRGVADYHRPTWPRRTRCKEGNLAYFYDHFGYDGYDVVLQFDADHVPAPTYLRWVLMAFADPAVGYVATPSVCDRNAVGSWAARGRVHLEAAMHGAAQAGYNDGWAPCCIGSHYAVRTEALREIGGLGPELAEDFSTSLLLSSAGWKGTFSIDAAARGEGPETVADAVTQDLQWSRSMMTLLLGGAARGALGRLPWPARVKLGFCLLWYPLGAGVLALTHALPAIAILSGTPLVRVELGAFALHLLPCVGVLLVMVGLLRRWGWLRPADAPVLSWEGALFALVRWPWTLIGCAQAIAGRVTGRPVDWKVTPKGGDGPQGLPLRVLAPPLVIALASAAPILLVPDPGPARGYLFWAVVNAILYFGVAVATVVLHLYEQRRLLAGGFGLLRALRAPLALSALVAAVVLPGAAAGARDVAGVWRAAPQPPPDGAVLPGLGRLARPALGVTTDSGARAVSSLGSGGLADVGDFERRTWRHSDIVMLFVDFGVDPAALGRRLRAIGSRGSVPEITLEPWDHRLGPYRSQPAFALDRIARGVFDRRLEAVGRVIAAYGRPVRLRFAQEMDGTAFPWSERRAPNEAGDFVPAWRHVHRTVRGAGATNARWVWAPLATTFDAALYPGHDVVDVIGLSGFNGGLRLRWGPWRSFAEIFGRAIDAAGRLAPGKPVEISEVGSAEDGGDKAAWIAGMWRELRHRPQVEAVIWFDVVKEADWRIGSSHAAQRAFAEGAAAAR
ncbi:MAG TPA: glycosyltransferase [Baekduia sp.]|nr:glycosyltransferase [Baekduia sp.]